MSSAAVGAAALPPRAGHADPTERVHRLQADAIACGLLPGTPGW